MRQLSRYKGIAFVAAMTALALVIATGPIAAEESEEEGRGTPPRLSFLDGPVSFWRPGAENWAPAQINVPLAPGDQLYNGPAANVELQIGPRAYLRAGAETQLGIENQEPDFLQVRVTTGHVSVDVRSMAVGHRIEVDTPNAAFIIDRTGYYRIDIDRDVTAFISRRGGQATMIPAGGEPLSVSPNEQVLLRGNDDPDIRSYAAPDVDDWDRWNYTRTDDLIEPVSARYVPPEIYGTETLDRYGDWREVDDYGPVWVPASVGPGWSPYSTGRWVWDPFYGWTWVDEAPWGWAPYHYGRWVHVHGFWGWAPGPRVVRPLYAPALVAFFHGPRLGVHFGVTSPGVGWVALGWGEPCVPWWGRREFAGRPWWGGWGGPRIVNNVVVEKTTVVNITNIDYRNARVPNAVVAAPADRFGRGRSENLRLQHADLQRLQPAQGALPIKPVAASFVPTTGRAVTPPEAILQRRVVATKAPRDTAAELRPHGLNVSPSVNIPAPRVVNAPRRPEKSVPAASRVPSRQEGTSERAAPAPAPAPPPQFGAPQQPARQPAHPGYQDPAGRERRAPRSIPEQRPPSVSAPSAPPPAQPQVPAIQPRQVAPSAPAPERRAPAAVERRAPAATERRAPAAVERRAPAPMERQVPAPPAAVPAQRAPAPAAVPERHAPVIPQQQQAPAPRAPAPRDPSSMAPSAPRAPERRRAAPAPAQRLSEARSRPPAMAMPRSAAPSVRAPEPNRKDFRGAPVAAASRPQSPSEPKGQPRR